MLKPVYIPALLICLLTWTFAIPLKISHKIPDELLISDSIVVCDFKLPDGHKVQEVLVGSKELLGQNWNSDSFPQQSIIVYETTFDHIGDSDRATLINTTGFYLYDSDSGMIYLNSTEGSKIEVTSLSNLKAALKN